MSCLVGSVLTVKHHSMATKYLKSTKDNIRPQKWTQIKFGKILTTPYHITSHFVYALCPQSRVTNNHISFLSATFSARRWHRQQTKVSKSDTAESDERVGFQVSRQSTALKFSFGCNLVCLCKQQNNDGQDTKRRCPYFSVWAVCASVRQCLATRALNSTTQSVTSVQRRLYTEIHIF
jgi:hypothetical protein